MILTDINQLTIPDNKIRKAETLLKLGTNYETNKIYVEALKMYVEALKIYEELKNKKMIEEIKIPFEIDTQESIDIIENSSN